MKSPVLKWELSGILFAFLGGSLLHFVFEWAGESRIIGLFAPVNESVWEHFKIGFWPVCLYAAIEYGFLRNYINNFFTAKAAATYVIPIIIGLAFYGYTAFTAQEILLLDILIFAVAVTAGQLISYRILTSRPLPRYPNIVSLAFIIILALILIICTIYPPHLPIFQDQNTGLYGIP
jgi:hypothetical protein